VDSPGPTPDLETVGSADRTGQQFLEEVVWRFRQGDEWSPAWIGSTA